MNETDLTEALRSLGAPDDRVVAAAGSLWRFAELIESANAGVNLVRAASLDEIVTRHVLDSAAGWAFLNARGLAAGEAIDVGSGAGLPAMVWGLLGGFDRVVACESTVKKSAFIAATTCALKFKRLEVTPRRAEVLGHDPTWRETFDVVTARALAPLRILLELTSPLARPGGRLLFFKGLRADEELAAAATAMATLNCALVERERYRIPDSDHGGELLLFEKTAPTPERHPRSAAAIKKRPLSNPFSNR